jgi:hypothetical protein
MKFVTFAALSAIAVIACSTQSLNAQQYKWQLTKPGDGTAALLYAGESEEDTPIVLNCKVRSGVIKVFVAETSKALKPNRPINATLAAGSVRSSVAGKTVPNEDAGVPSFESTLQASDPLLDALTGTNSLSIDVGASHQQVPLKGIGNKSREFATLCRMP